VDNTYHLLVLTETEALDICQALMEDFKAMVHARVSSEIDPKAKTEGIVQHARWVFPLAESLKRIRAGLYQWPSEWFQYIRRVAEEHGASDALRVKLTQSSEYSYTPDEIRGVRSEMIAEINARKGRGGK